MNIRFHKSTARLKIALYAVFALSSIVLFKLIDNNISQIIFISVFFYFCAAVMFIRCENCKTLLYRWDIFERGIFLFYHIPPKQCPVCGVERY